MKRVIIVASDLKDTIGHEFEYIHSAATAFKNSGYAVCILGGVDAIPEVAALEGFVASFRRVYKPAGAKTWPWEVLRIGLLFLLELQRIVESFPFDKDDVVFVPTILQPYFAGWVWALIRFGGRLPPMVLLFRFSLELGYPSRFNRMRQLFLPLTYRLLFWIIEQCPRKPILVSDSDDLQQEYKQYTRMPVALMPIPLDMDHLERYSCRNDQTPRNAMGPHIVYLGDARRGKGFDLLPLLVEGLRNDGRFRFRMTIHCGRPADRLADLATADAYARLLQLAEAGVITLITSNLPGPLYHALLLDAEIVLLPYRREYYGAQTSNVLVEGFVAGKPVVAPRGTWLGNQVLLSGAGVVFESGDAESLVEATLLAIESLPKYADAAFRQRVHWKATHNADRLVEEMKRLLAL